MCPQLTVAFPTSHTPGPKVPASRLSICQQLVVTEGQASTLKLLWCH